MRTAEYGTWTSPITAESLVEASVGLSQVELDGNVVHWVESRPNEGGRCVVVRAAPDGGTTELVPEGFSARTAVHEYGGRCYTGVGGVVVVASWEDQRLWRIDPDAGPGHRRLALTPEPSVPRGDRYADPVVTPDRRWIICVRESHRPTPAGEQVDNDLVAIPFTPAAPPAEPLVLAAGHDFYSAPAVSPDGTELAWLSWDHPNMPWDETELWRARLSAPDADAPSLALEGPVLVAGRESVAQPRWSPAGILHYVSDRTGWWNLYTAAGDPLFPIAAECNEPGWVFGTATYGFTPAGDLVATWGGTDGAHLGRIADGRASEIATPFTSFTSLRVAGSHAFCVAGSPTASPAVVRIDLGNGSVEVLARSREVDVDPGYLSTPERIRFPTGDGEEAWALVYAPANEEFEAPAGTLPPLVVTSHGGPTSAATAVLNPRVQFWTSRGFMLADVDYRGSTGYGRAYRERLRDNWGIFDVEDCAAAAVALAAAGRADPERAVIRGGSAGGFTTLAALAFTDHFAAGASHYGVADLELLAKDTHKFESRYLDRLVGPYPEAAEVYRARSPIHHTDRFDCPIILFQGLEDKVVPPEQSELISDALRRRGVPVAYLSFEGEQHGFRRAETVVAVANAELAFFGRVLGFTPAGAVDVAVDNAGALHT